MTALDTEFRQVALDMLEEFGMDAQYKQTAGAAYNPGSLDAEAGSQTTIPVRSFIYDATIEDIERGVVERGECVALVAGAALPAKAVPGDVIEFPHETVTVKKAVAIWSGEQVALWQLAVVR